MPHVSSLRPDWPQHMAEGQRLSLVILSSLEASKNHKCYQKQIHPHMIYTSARDTIAKVYCKVTGGHYITMLPADRLISTSHDTIVLQFLWWKMLWN